LKMVVICVWLPSAWCHDDACRRNGVRGNARTAGRALVDLGELPERVAATARLNAALADACCRDTTAEAGAATAAAAAAVNVERAHRSLSQSAALLMRRARHSPSTAHQ
jgi:hypothetical protein